MNLTDAITGYWLERKRQLSPNTYNDYQRTFQRFAAYHADCAIESITPNHVRRFLNHIAAEQDANGATISDKTLSNIWVALSALFTWAETELGIAHPIRDRVKRPQYKPKPIQPYTQDEINAILRVTDQTTTWRTRNGSIATSKRPTALRDRAIILTLLDTGIRATECCNLSYSDYDAANDRLLIQHGKGDKARYVYIGESTRRALWRYLAGRTVGPLFATRTNTHLDRSELRKLIERLGRRANVRHANAHRFRHTFAVAFLRNGGNVFALKEILGHATLDTIKIYVRLAERDIGDAQRRASPVDNWNLR